MSDKPLVSVIFAAYNEQSQVDRLIKSLRHQSYPNIEIIVVDDGSSDQTVQVARKLRAKVYARIHAERSVQRNFGVSHAKGKYILILDADMELTPDVISQCVAQKAEVVFIPEQSIGHTFWEKVKAFERSFYATDANHYVESARFFSKSAFIKASGYDESITGPEDWDLSEKVLKLGYKPTKITAVVYHHERIKSLWQQVRKFYYYGLRAHRTLSRQSSVFSPKTIYFLRPQFYRQWSRLLFHPVLTIGMIIILTVQAISGGIGYLVGRIKNV